MLQAEKSGLQVPLPLKKYEVEALLSGDKEDVFVEEDCQEGTSEEDDNEQGFTNLMDPESELFMEYERDRHNTPICKLVPATANNLQWDHFTGQPTRKKGAKISR